MSKTYYVDLKDGYSIGDLYEHQGKKYEVVEIEAFNQLMLVEEIEDEPQSNN
tara:strand:- start:432 stop:587 length:156 start_codon:yes stop_codon:yes gene_type:complete